SSGCFPSCCSSRQRRSWRQRSSSTHASQWIAPGVASRDTSASFPECARTCPAVRSIRGRSCWRSRRSAFSAACGPRGAVAGTGLLDGLRRRRLRAGDDPRLPYLVIGGLALWTVTSGLVPYVQSLTLYLARILPGLGTIRGIADGSVTVIVCSSLLAAYGTLA